MTSVSVIIPAFNAAALIRETLESVLSQDYEAVEVIVVDDGSTDDTLDVVRSVSPAIKILRQRNSGAAEARNRGASEASGDWLAFLDADDLWCSNKLSTQLLECGQFAFSHTNSWYFGESLPHEILKTDIVPQSGGNVLEQLLVSNFITTSTVLVRRDLFLDIGGFSSDFRDLEDWELWLRLCGRQEIGYVAKPLARYRVHASSMTLKTRKLLPLHEKTIQHVFSANGPGHAFPRLKRKALASSYRINAHYSAESGDWPFSLYCAFKSVVHEPTALAGWKHLAKAPLQMMRVRR